MEEVAVTLRFRPPRPVSFVDLRGELTTWRAEHPFSPADGGWLETTLRLPPGTYAYKLRLSDGEWLLDPENPRTRGAGGARNSLLVVDVSTAGGAARSDTYAVWITTPTAELPATVYKAYAWTNCANGVVDATSCA